MRQVLQLFLFFIISLTVGCKKSEQGVDLVDPVGDVYIAGYIDNTDKEVVYWKNGVRTLLAQSPLSSQTNPADGHAYGIAVFGTNVHVVGNIGFTAKYWRNGVETSLTDGYSASAANAIALSNGNVYMCGYMYDANYNHNVYWNNGTRTILSNILPSPETNGICVSGTHIYIVGSIGDTAILWKDGIRTTLPGSYAKANSVAVSGSDVYVGGSAVGKAAYWKNGILTVLSGEASTVYGIATLNNDLYAVGWAHGKAVMWKNDVESELATSDTEYGTAAAITIVDGNIYVAGNVMGRNFNFAVYWKNGERHNVDALPVLTGNIYATAITVIKH